MNTPNDAYYSTMDSIITTIHRKLPKADQTPEYLERLLDDILLHFKYEAMQKEK
ncbi:hypothetical protein [Eubacterium aggregans]|uniref:Uncharacterized protein n=1 Tax=Eubacterium aggregans TaxID=81409 RepID=A0A1H4BZJ3_9FIRM|nr:hypothetical protein [Eubacterium aggregans]MDD4690985.1 hypothetical protein [Eubacterium aggregans]SEA53625.1 hypothetical protein SAMN04515656_11314 [Eubacterium aggregans]